MYTEPELLNERLERLASVLDEIMPMCALLVRDAIALLKEQNGWRLCSEELPETNDEVLTTYIVNGNTKKRFVEAASYWDDGDGEGHWNSVWDEYRVPGTKIEVIAWMPLPKPYRQ